ncbi:hypothetical protein ACFVWZ_15405 [Streptomyces sp. NPDC058200]|uniref:hypothetical protein n=1 Tax=Streptomyces sp. NPDC058200 TaxID=3346378 RepID=UPI0036EF3EC6
MSGVTERTDRQGGSGQAGKSGPDQAQAQTQAPEHGPDGALRMHTLHAELPIPYLTPGDITANARAARAKLAPMPAPKQIAFYGGLGALAVLGAVEWPVAAAIGAAAAIARSGRRSAERGNGHGGERADEDATQSAEAAQKKAGQRGADKKRPAA